MAGDWIKMRTDLQDDPQVLRLSAMLKLDRFSVVGRLATLWAWADKHTTDGSAAVTPLLLDDLVSHAGFADAMTVVGWLEVSDKGIKFPKFNRHNGKSAKKRALTARRVASHKKRKGNAQLTLVALPREEKRRVVKEAHGPNGPSPSGPVWGEGLSLLVGAGVQEPSARRFLGMILGEWDEPVVLAALNASIGKADPLAYCRGILKTKPKKARLSKESAEILAELRREFGDQVTSDGKSFHHPNGMRWKLNGERMVSL